MMKHTMFHLFTLRLFPVLGVISVTVLAFTACVGGTPSSHSPTAVFTANGSEPQNPLLPSNTNENGGGKIIDAIFAGLISYDVNGKPLNDIAQSIESSDSQYYTVKIRDNASFTNGEKVRTKSFVDAWNYAALLSNKQLNSYFFENIQGFSYKTDSNLTGLSIVDDTTFTIALDRPISDFPLRLGFSAYYPLPSVAFDNVAAFGENPIGNGPYRLASPTAWQHNEKIDLARNENYQGPRSAENGGVSIIFYASVDAAYADLLGGNLDILDQIPESALPLYVDDLGARAVNQPAAVFHSFTAPEWLPHFSGDEGRLRRQALSLAINRSEITDTIFSNTRTPARDFTSPVLDGYSSTIPGSEVLTYDPEKARALWAEADALSPWTGMFQIAYNVDGGNQGWVDAVTNSVKNVLRIDTQGAPYPTFAELRTAVTKRTITTAFRTGWRAGYPGMYNFLGPLYTANGAANDSGYNNPQFDSVLNSGLNLADLNQANQVFQEAQEILFRDLPAIPLWYGNINGGYSTRVSAVQFAWNSVPLYYAVRVE